MIINSFLKRIFKAFVTTVLFFIVCFFVTILAFAIIFGAGFVVAYLIEEKLIVPSTIMDVIIVIIGFIAFYAVYRAIYEHLKEHE